MADESMQDKYARLLREGKTSEATEVAEEMNDVNHGVESSESESSEDNGYMAYTELNGVGEELAEEMFEEFGAYEAFVEKADVESLTDISGIGEARAESLLEQVEEE